MSDQEIYGQFKSHYDNSSPNWGSGDDTHTFNIPDGKKYSRYDLNIEQHDFDSSAQVTQEPSQATGTVSIVVHWYFARGGKIAYTLRAYAASSAKIQQVGNVLLVTGKDQDNLDIHGDGFQGRLREALYNTPPGTSPVARGTHDFWIVLQVPTLDDGSHSYEDLTATPRKMRGILALDFPGSLDQANDISGWISVAMQEAGHHWLVPRDLKFMIDGAEVPLSTGNDFLRSVNDEAGFLGPILLGREDSHWSPFFQSDNSPLDGVYSIETGREQGVARWEQQEFPADLINPGNGLIPFRKVEYDDLEQIIMGIKSLDEAYPQTGGRFSWIEPRLTAPLSYFAGLFVAFGPNDFIQFGFNEDHRALSLVRTGQPPIITVQLNEFLPLEQIQNEYFSPGKDIRIVRTGNHYEFQVLPEDFLRGCLTWIFQWLHITPFFPMRLETFRTIASFESDQPPQAVGLIVKTQTGLQHFAEGAFQDIKLNDGRRETTLITNAVPPLMVSGATFDSLSVGEWRQHLPAEGAIIRSRNGELRIITPRFAFNPDGSSIDRNAAYDHTPTIDQAPKILTRAPDGDFVFTTHVKAHRAMLSPWSGARTFGTTIYGTAKSLPVSSVVVPEHIQQQKWPAPDNNTYKFAFIIVAKNRSDITDNHIQLAEGIRPYFDIAFTEATGGRRHSDSTL